ncbi:MAG: enoyl-CoA hydratase-related protein [Myxococcota bacterium]|nr:enoyl-CoA hydratase-related protein [Myxococcota bacterium]
MSSDRTVHLYSTIKVAFDDRVAVVTLNRPKALNAINSTMVQELGEVLDEVTQREALAVVLTGAGPKAFAAGADISEMRRMSPAEAARFAEQGQRVFSRLESFDRPIIAAVNGYALGGGCELAMSCDIILAAKNAVFGQPEVKLGVIPGFGGSQRMTRLVGRQRAREICYTGRSVRSEEAARIGLAARVAEGDVVAEAMSLANQIANNAPRAVSLCKRAINTGADLDMSSALAHEAQLFGLCFASSDQKEGMSAFLDKRPPNFTGR